MVAPSKLLRDRLKRLMRRRDAGEDCTEDLVDTLREYLAEPQ